MVLPRAFYDRPTLDVARALLGKTLVHQMRGRRTSGLIVEVEAYIGEADPACHAAAGRTRRNAPLYGPPGFAYVYLNYGIHHLVNAVTEAEGAPAAVLIRALAPLEGFETMVRRRTRPARGRRPTGRDALTPDTVCRGPGNLTMAMGIGLEDCGRDLAGPRLFVEDSVVREWRVVWGPRIGIRVGTDRMWRAWFDGHPAVSAARVSAPGTSLPQQRA